MKCLDCCARICSTTSWTRTKKRKPFQSMSQQMLTKAKWEKKKMKIENIEALEGWMYYLFCCQIQRWLLYMKSFHQHQPIIRSSKFHFAFIFHFVFSLSLLRLHLINEVLDVRLCKHNSFSSSIFLQTHQHTDVYLILDSRYLLFNCIPKQILNSKYWKISKKKKSPTECHWERLHW